MEGIASIVGVRDGFTGCVERLIINDEDCDMRKQPLGLSIHGIDVGKDRTLYCLKYPVHTSFVHKIVPACEGNLSLIFTISAKKFDLREEIFELSNMFNFVCEDFSTWQFGEESNFVIP